MGALGSPKSRPRFEREVELASRLAHPHIARVYESGLYQGLYYYAMELVEGAPLDDFARTHGFDRRQSLSASVGQAETTGTPPGRRRP